MLLLPFNLVWLALILASIFDKNVAINEPRLMATIQQNLIYALFPADRFYLTRYNFNEVNGFEEWRLEQLVIIADKDNTKMPRGSTQSNDALIHDEWIYIENPKNIKPKYYFHQIEGAEKREIYKANLEKLKNSVGVFKNAVDGIITKIKKFKSEHNLLHNKCTPKEVKNCLKNGGGDEMDQTDLEEIARPEETSETNKNAKKGKGSRYFQKLCGCFVEPSTSHDKHPSGEDEHSLPPPKHSKNIQTDDQFEELINLVIECKVFIRDLHSEGGEGSLIDIFSFMEKHPEMKDLKNIFELSKIQTEELDQAIFKRIYEEHRKKSKSKRAIVQGAGPVEGVNVTLVNDRSEEYIRNRVVFFDRKWMSQLRFFLGTEFDKLFFDNENEEKSLGMILDEDIGYINEKEEERTSQEIRHEITEEIRQENQKEKSFLNLIYNTSVLDINTKYEKPLAVVVASNKPRDPGSFNFNHLKEILTNYEGMKMLEDETIGIPFDLFFCAGGARDQIRTKFIEEPKQLTQSINYGVAIFDKVKHDVKVFTDNATFYRNPMKGMRPHLKRQKIDKLISDADFISEQLKKRYAKINKLIIHGMAEVKSPIKADEEKKYAVNHKGNLISKKSSDEQIVVRLFESNPTLHIASITPLALVEFIEELKIERNLEENSNKIKKFDDLHDKLQKRWAKALFDYTFSVRHPERFGQVVIEGAEYTSSRTLYKGKKISQPQQTLKYDPHSANTSTFYVGIYGVEEPVKEIRGTKDSAIIAAIGDANTSSHFMTSSRFGVERAVNAIKQYYENPDKSDLRKMMNSALKKVRRRVLEKAKEYVKILDGIKVDLDD
uniref:Uncharacterized protein n=1 Tax=Meloidogyne javanica TaxID=6303 RepID=A0A915LSJ9_MELJA